MQRYAVFSRRRITAILTTQPLGRESLSIPSSLSHVSDSDLIAQYEIRNQSVEKIGSLVSKPRVAVISNWKVNCGIATYTEYLVQGLRKIAGSVKIFAEIAEGSQIESDVVRCWDRKGDYSRILPEIEKYNPDLIIIQHEFGLFHKVNLWQCLLSQLSRWRVITTFHTVLEHRIPNVDASLDYRARSFAEVACPEIIVHQKKARETLRDRGYSGRVHYIPHGCFEPFKEKRLQPQKYGMYTDYTMFQYGFGGRHKGWEFAIQTVEILKSKYPDVLYLGMFNIPVNGENDTYLYHLELLDLIKKKGLTENVSIIRGFQSEAMLRNLLSGVKVGLFPYQSPKNWFSWGASGAVQMPLSMGLPLVLGEFSQFEEYRGKIPIVKTPQDAAQEIDHLFSDSDYWKKMSEVSYKISAERTWDKVAEWYLNCTSAKDFDAL
jgi:glycosyltransferase involved in cell wall biosynthesis